MKKTFRRLARSLKAGSRTHRLIKLAHELITLVIRHVAFLNLDVDLWYLLWILRRVRDQERELVCVGQLAKSALPG